MKTDCTCSSHTLSIKSYMQSLRWRSKCVWMWRIYLWIKREKTEKKIDSHNFYRKIFFFWWWFWMCHYLKISRHFHRLLFFFFFFNFNVDCVRENQGEFVSTSGFHQSILLLDKGKTLWPNNGTTLYWKSVILWPMKLNSFSTKHSDDNKHMTRDVHETRRSRKREKKQQKKEKDISFV